MLSRVHLICIHDGFHGSCVGQNERKERENPFGEDNFSFSRSVVNEILR